MFEQNIHIEGLQMTFLFSKKKNRTGSAYDRSASVTQSKNETSIV